MAVIGSTGTLCIFFFSGPFAWNGAIGFYLPVGAYVLFLPITWVMFYRTIRAEKLCYEAAESSPAERGTPAMS